MMSFSNFTVFNNINPLIFIILAIWEIIWKGIGMWHAAKNNQKNWFIAILAVNSVGILPIIYLNYCQKKQK